MTRNHAIGYRRKNNSGHCDPFPVHKLKRIDRPTTLIDDQLVQRVDERHGGFHRSGMGEYGEFLKKEYKRFVPKHPLSGAIVTMTGALGSLVDTSGTQEKGNATPWGVSSWTPMPPVAADKAPQTDNPLAMSRHIKETAYFLRADMVGICHLPPYAVFSHNKFDGSPVKLDHKYAIAIVIDQDWPTAEAFNGNDWISNSMSFLAYSTSGFIACILADYIRRLGYPARAHHAMNYQVVVPPILLWAGLGEMCRIGDVVLNPFLGSRFKAAVVTTDLPLEIDKPIDFGLQDFCNKCGKCARECPAQAVSYGDKIKHNGYEKWPNDVAKCTGMRVGNKYGSGCGTCIKVCPWNKPYTPFHRMVGRIMMRFPFAHRFAIWGDDLMGYGKAKPDQKWWLDLEDVDGVVQNPVSLKDDLPS
jgi:reductive dehalogenase